jgi:hypothetical protein
MTSSADCNAKRRALIWAASSVDVARMAVWKIEQE